ncbi:COMPASS-like H3K4 histone methylase component WDR5B isoform X2 [Zingiber officinale]|uniref:COMPASS-like H3K4 histone methylase component WDR5B isoform X2 n=1 Tax=Zingiber officinale TaxID=94328 RepID=UPI001C4C6308|nr:COMPASS-like H3K4 histone methylase component WDR5B isoform X2 [Zingiber officinale]
MSAPVPGGASSTAAEPPPYRPYTLAHVLTGHSRAVSCVKFSNDGLLLASASLDKTVIIWSAKTFAAVSTLIGHAEGISDVAWSSDSHYICSASDDRTLRVWDVRPPTDCVRILRGHLSLVFCVDFNPPSDRIASGSFDQTVRIWDVKSGKCVTTIEAHDEPVTSVHFIRDGSIIVSGSRDGSCKIWDAVSGARLKVLIDDKTPAVSFAKFAPNGKFILIATLDDTLAHHNAYPFGEQMISLLVTYMLIVVLEEHNSEEDNDVKSRANIEDEHDIVLYFYIANTSMAL